MKILIGCEFSQIVTMAFRERGHEAFSCDILPCEGSHPEWHYQKDIIEVINMKHWDFIGLHQPCTKIALSGNRTYAKGKPKHQERLDAIEWTIGVWELACDNADMVYMENPLGAMNSDKRLPKPQLIHPYFFGDNVPKKTCLWLKGLSPLVWADQNTLFETKTSVEPEYLIYKSKKNKSGTSKYSIYGKLGKGKGHERSITFPGIAKAMAEQWG